MNSSTAVRATARLSGFLFRNAFPLYVALYENYKRVADRGEIALIRRLVHPGDDVVDVGANIGFYTQVLAQCVGTNGHVFAFEPDALNFRRLSVRTAPSLQVEAVRAAVTDRSGNIDLHVSRDLSVDHRIYATDEARRTVVVNAVALDDFFRERRRPIQFIKMDIQGAEHAALRGMRGVIERSPSLRILMEMWPTVLNRFGSGTDALLELVESYDLETRLVRGDGGLGEELKSGTSLPDERQTGPYFAVLCARRGWV